MPRRVIDFDAMWASDKLASCAEWAQAEYAWFYGLADASGSFELTNLRVIWGRVAAIRRSLTIERLTEVFEEFMQRGLLFTWEENGKRYGHWTGSDVPGRLPAPSWRARLERLAPPVPREKLAAYMARFGGQPLAAGRACGRAETAGLDMSDSEQMKAEQNKGAQNAQLELKLGLEATQGQDLGLNLSLDLDLDSEMDRETKRLCLADADHFDSTGRNAEELRDLPEKMLAIYDAERGNLPEASQWTPERRRQCEQRLEEGLTLGDFRAAVRRAAATPFMAGAGERGWRASFDWFVSNGTNVRKVLEGRYDSPATAGAARPAHFSEKYGASAGRSASGALVGAGPQAAAFGARAKAAAVERSWSRDHAGGEVTQAPQLRERAS